MWCWRLIIICLTLRLVVCQNLNITEEERILKHWKSLEKSLSKMVNNGIKSMMPMAMGAITEIKLSSECQTSLMKFLFGLMKLRTWAFELIDACGKPTPGILYGSIAMYGHYEQCLNLKATDDKNKKELFTGTYCSIGINFKLPPKPDNIIIYEPMDIFKNFTEKKDTVIRFLAKFAQLLYGFHLRYDVCLPSKCKQEDVQSILDYVQRDIDIVRMNVSWCDVREDMELDLAHFICTWSIVIVVILVAIGTTLDLVQHFGTIRKAFAGLGKKGKYLTAFSACKSTTKLYKSVTDKRIASLHGIRLISIVMTLVISTLLNFDFDIFTGLFNLFNLPFWTSAQILLHGILYIDTLFLISGVTVMYTNIPREDSKDGRFHVIAYIIRRLFRIIPTYLFIMACVIVLPNAASGPMWDQITKYDAKLCREHWWENILFFNNFVTKSADLCLHQSWYVATDFQLYLIALIIIGLIVVWRSPMWAAFVASTLSVAGMIAVGVVTYVYHYSPTILVSTLDIEKIRNYQDVIYHKPHDHIASFSVGLAIGYMFVKKPKMKIPMYVRLFGWAISTCLWSSILFGITPWNKGNLPSGVLATVFAATHRFAWAVAISWIIIVSYYGYGGVINCMLSHRLFVPFSRLSFTVLLGFTICYNMVFGYYRAHIDINRIDFVIFAIGYLVLIYAVGYFLYIFIDGPTIALKNLIFYHPRSNSETCKLPMEHVNGTCTKRAVDMEKMNGQRMSDISFLSTSSVTELTKTEHNGTKESFNYRL